MPAARRLSLRSLLRALAEGTTFILKPGAGLAGSGEGGGQPWPQPQPGAPGWEPALGPWAEPPGPPPACTRRRFLNCLLREISVESRGPGVTA